MPGTGAGIPHFRLLQSVLFVTYVRTSFCIHRTGMSELTSGDEFC